MKVVINNCYGGFGLSLKGKKRLGELMGVNVYFYTQNCHTDEFVKVDENSRDFMVYALTVDLGEKTNKLPNDGWFECEGRDNPCLIQVVKELGKEANGRCAELKIVDIPDGVDWEIQEYDGNEWVAEKHQTWS